MPTLTRFSGVSPFSFLMLAALTTPSCGGGMRTIVYRYALSPCPDSTFSLPAEAQHGTYRITSRGRELGPVRGATYTLYELTEPDAKAKAPPVRFAVRRSLATACGIEFAWQHFVRDTAEARLMEIATRHDAEHAVLTLLSNAAVQPLVPASWMDTLSTLAEWDHYPLAAPRHPQ